MASFSFLCFLLIILQPSGIVCDPQGEPDPPGWEPVLETLTSLAKQIQLEGNDSKLLKKDGRDHVLIFPTPYFVLLHSQSFAVQYRECPPLLALDDAVKLWYVYPENLKLHSHPFLEILFCRKPSQTAF